MSCVRVAWVMLWVLLVGWGAHAADVAPIQDSLVPQRQRIAEQRALNEAIFLNAQQACMARFAVTDCLTQARRERRAAMDDLRRQEIVLNDLDRQAKAAAALTRVQNNKPTGGLLAEEVPPQPGLQGVQDRQQRSDDVQNTSTVVVRPAPVSSPVTVPTKQQNVTDEALNQQRYAEKLLEAQRRKAEKTRSLRDKSQAKPLPLPADM